MAPQHFRVIPPFLIDLLNCLLLSLTRVHLFLLYNRSPSFFLGKIQPTSFFSFCVFHYTVLDFAPHLHLLSGAVVGFPFFISGRPFFFLFAEAVFVLPLGAACFFFLASFVSLPDLFFPPPIVFRISVTSLSSSPGGLGPSFLLSRLVDNGRLLFVCRRGFKSSPSPVARCSRTREMFILFVFHPPPSWFCFFLCSQPRQIGLPPFSFGSVRTQVHCCWFFVFTSCLLAYFPCAPRFVFLFFFCP